MYAAGHAETGNDIPCCSRPRGPSAWRAVPLHRPQVLRQPDAGLDLPGPARDGHGRSGGADDRARLHAARHRGLSVEETWDVLGMRATRSDDTVLDGAFVPDRYIARVVPAGGGGRRRVRPRRVRLGADGVRQHLLRARAPRARPDRRGREDEGLHRPLAPDGVPRRSAARRRRDGARARVGDRTAPRSGGRRLGGRGEPRRRLAQADPAAKYHAVEGSWRVVDLALDLAGGFGIFRRAGSNGCSATHGWGGSIRPTRC